jgi:hypothetical protein
VFGRDERQESAEGTEGATKEATAPGEVKLEFAHDPEFFERDLDVSTTEDLTTADEAPALAFTWDKLGKSGDGSQGVEGSGVAAVTGAGEGAERAQSPQDGESGRQDTSTVLSAPSPAPPDPPASPLRRSSSPQLQTAEARRASQSLSSSRRLSESSTATSRRSVAAMSTEGPVARPNTGSQEKPRPEVGMVASPRLLKTTFFLSGAQAPGDDAVGASISLSLTLTGRGGDADGGPGVSSAPAPLERASTRMLAPLLIRRGSGELGKGWATGLMTSRVSEGEPT